MDAEQPGWLEKKALDLVVGIEIGILGGIVMLIWLTLTSPLIGTPWWFIPNLYGSHSYNWVTINHGPGLVTISGIALHFLIAGIVGGIAGLWSPQGRLYGLGIALAWYLFSVLYIWKRWAPLLPMYASPPLLMMAYFLYGSTLGWHAALRQRLSPSVAATPEPPPVGAVSAPEPPPQAPESPEH